MEDDKRKEELNKLFFEYLNKTDWENALKCINELIELYPKESKYYNNRGNLYKNLGKYKKAEEDYTKAIEIIFNYVNDNKIDILYSKKEYSIEVIKLRSNLSDAYYNRGNLYLNLGRNEEAEADYTKAIEINPNDAQAYNNKGTLYYNLGRYKEAEVDYTKAIQLNPNYSQAYNNRGVLYTNLGRNEEAEADYNKAIKINPNYPQAYYSKGILYINSGKYKEALENYNKAIELNPNYVEAYYSRGNLYLNLGKYKEAEEDYNKAIQLDKNFKDGYIALSYIYYKKENYNKAIENLEEGIKIYDNDKKDIKQNKNLSEVTKSSDEKIESVNTIVKNNIFHFIDEILDNEKLGDKLNKKEKILLIELIFNIKNLLNDFKVPIKNKKFSHYTKSTNIKYLLNRENPSKFRLNNAVYMNDPEEGKILNKIL